MHGDLQLISHQSREKSTRDLALSAGNSRCLHCMVPVQASPAPRAEAPSVASIPSTPGSFGDERRTWCQIGTPAQEEHMHKFLEVIMTVALWLGYTVLAKENPRPWTLKAFR